MNLHIVRVENGTDVDLPLDQRISPVTEPRFYNVQVLPSGLTASLLKRLGLVDALPRNTGLDSLRLDATPFPTSAYNYVGVMSEIPASYAASATPQRGTIPEFNLIFQTTSIRKERNTDCGFKFSARREVLPSRQLQSNGASEGGWRGRPLAFLLEG